jgi:N-acetylglutamate synthase-like GNAT family acetyltransferase
MRIYSRGAPPGIGRAILAALETEALTAGYRSLIAQTHGLNGRAIAFYEANGFEAVERPAASVSDTAMRCFARTVGEAPDDTPASGKHVDTDSTERGEHN